MNIRKQIFRKKIENEFLNNHIINKTNVYDVINQINVYRDKVSLINDNTPSNLYLYDLKKNEVKEIKNIQVKNNDYKILDFIEINEDTYLYIEIMSKDILPFEGNVGYEVYI